MADRRLELILCMQDLSSAEIQRSIWVDQNYDQSKYDKSPYSYYDMLILDLNLDDSADDLVGRILKNQHEADVVGATCHLFREIYDEIKGDLEDPSTIMKHPKWPKLMGAADEAYIVLLS